MTRIFNKFLDLILRYVNKLIADWVEPVFSEQIDISSILKGKINISHVQVKQKVIEVLPLPVNLIFNYVGTVKVSIPLYALFAKPITASVEDVILVLAARPANQWNADEWQLRFLKMKEGTLAAGEAAAFLSSFENGFLWRIAMRLAKNVKVTVKNVHIRFEDRISRKDNGMAIGICVKNLEVNSTDWSELPYPLDVSDKTNVLPKKLRIDGFGLYVEDLNTGVPRGSDLLTPFIPPLSTNEEEAGEPQSSDVPVEMSKFASAKVNFEESLSKRYEQQMVDKPSTEAESGWFRRWFCGKKVETTEEAEIKEEQEEDQYSAGGNDAGRRFRRGWQTDLSDNTDQDRIYAFDGSVPWRRLLAPFCRRRLYDLSQSTWVDDPSDIDLGLPKPKEAKWMCGDGKGDEDVKDEYINFYENTDAYGHVQGSGLLAEVDPVALSSEDVLKLAATAEPDEPILVQTAPDGSWPSLHLKMQELNNFLMVCGKLSDAYHSYILEPRTLELVLTLTVVPVIPNSPSQRCWSKWGEQRRPKSELLMPLPTARADIILAGLRIKLADFQALHLLKWMEYSLLLYGGWMAGLQSDLEAPIAPHDEQATYVDLWKKKLLQAEKVAYRSRTTPPRALTVFVCCQTDQDVVDWCKEFEMKYSYQSVAILRNKVLGELQGGKSRPSTSSSDGETRAPSTDDQQTPTSPYSFEDNLFESGYSSTSCSAFPVVTESPSSLSQDSKLLQKKPESSWNCCACAKSTAETEEETVFQSPVKLAESAANKIKEVMPEDEILHDLSRLRTTRFEVDLILDLVLLDLNITYYYEGRGVGVSPDRLGQRSLTILASALHLHLETQNVSDQEMSMDLELYPISILNVSRHLDAPEIPPDVSPILLTSFEGAATSLTGQPRQRRRRFFWSRTEEGNEYQSAIVFLKTVEPGVYLRMDSQSFKTIEKPDVRMVLRSTTEMVVLLIPQQLLKLFKEALSIIDTATKSDLAGIITTAAAASVEAGAEFTAILAKGDVEHNNAEVEIVLKKTVRVIIPRSATTLDCEGFVLDLGRLKLHSELAPQRLQYPPDLSKDQMYDKYKIMMTGLQLRRIGNCTDVLKPLVIYAGGVDLRLASHVLAGAKGIFRGRKRRETFALSSNLVADQNLIRETAEDAQSMNPSVEETMHSDRHRKSMEERRQNRRKEREEALGAASQIISTESSYLIYPISTDTVEIEVCHVATRVDLPVLHVDFVQDEIFIDICDYDIEFFSALMSESLEILYSFIDELESITIRQGEGKPPLAPLEPGRTFEHLFSYEDANRMESATEHKWPPTVAVPKRVHIADVVEDAQVALRAGVLNREGSTAGDGNEEFRNVNERNIGLSGEKSLVQAQQKFNEARLELLNRQGADAQIHLHAGINLIHIRVMKRDALPTSPSGRTRTTTLSEKTSVVMKENPKPSPPRRKESSGQQKRQMQSFGFHSVQTTLPLISITLTQVGAIIQNSESGCIELGAGIGGLIINEECNIAPLPLSSLYTHLSSFAKSKVKKSMLIGGPKDPVKDLQSMFGTLGIISTIGKTQCQAASICFNASHMGVYYHIDVRKNQQNALISIGTFRIVALWEVLDELLCWSMSIMEGLEPLPQRQTETKIPIPPLQYRETQELEKLTAAERAGEMMTAFTVDGSPSPTLNPPSGHSPLHHAFKQEKNGAHNKGYVLRPGIKLGVMISPFEILLPAEPSRTPLKERRVSSEKSLKAGQSSSRGSGRFGLSGGKGPKVSQQPQEPKHVSMWKKLRSVFELDNEEWAVPLSTCVIIKAAIEMKAVIFFYVPDPDMRTEDVEPIPMLVDPKTMKQIPTTRRRLLSDPSAYISADSRSRVYGGLSVDLESGAEARQSLTRQQADLNDGDFPSEEANYHWLTGGDDHVFEEVEQYMKEHPNPMLALLCPCCIKFGVTVSQLLIATAAPEAYGPLRRSRVDWDSIIRSNSALLTPLRLEIDSDIFFPSARCVYERMRGITPEAANIIRRSRGLFVSKYPEGVEATINIEPIILNIDSDSCIVLYQLLSVVDGFSLYLNDKFPPVAPELATSGSTTYGGATMDIDTELERAETDVFSDSGREEDIGLNFIRTFSVEIGVMLDLIRLQFWDTFSAQRRCCISIDVEYTEFAMTISPQRSPLPHMEDYWWNAFNPPRVVFYDSFLARMIDEPFDLERLNNPFARRKRKTKSFVSRMWSSTKTGVGKGYRRVYGWLSKVKVDEVKEREIDDEIRAESNNAVTEKEEEPFSKSQSSKDMEKGGYFTLKEAEQYAKTRPPWIAINGGFDMNAEFLNRFEKSNFTVLETFKFDVYGMKPTPDSPTTVSVEGSWINLNVNVALVDAVLVYVFSIVGAGVKRREKLHLDTVSKFFKNRQLSEDGQLEEIDDKTEIQTQYARKPTRLGTKPLWEVTSDTEAKATLDTASVHPLSQSFVSNTMMQAYRIGKLHFFTRPRDRFDLLECLIGAMNLSLIGEAILSKSSSFLNPAAGFSGDGLQGQMNQTNNTKKKLMHSAVGNLIDAKEKISMELRHLPQVYNLLGQSIGVFSRSVTALQHPSSLPPKVQVSQQSQQSGTWTIIPHVKSAPLPLDVSGKPQPFVIRLQLLDCLFDIPSSYLKLDQESLELITLSFVCPTEEEGALVAAGRLMAKVAAKGAEAGRRQLHAKQPHGVVSPRQQSISDATNPMNTKTDPLRPFRVSITQMSSSRQRKTLLPHESVAKVERTGWNPDALPERRNAVKILVRTSQRVTQADRLCFDIFLTSTMVVRNNTSLGFQLFNTIPGPLTKEPIGSCFGMYHAVPPDPNVQIPVDPKITGKSFRSKQKRENKVSIVVTSYHFSQQEIEKQQQPNDTQQVPDFHVTFPSGTSQGNIIISIEDVRAKDNNRAEGSVVGSTISAADIPYGSTLSYQQLQQRTDIMKLDPFDQRVTAVPLHWLVCRNSRLWATGFDEKLFLRGDLRDIADDCEKSDMLLSESVVTECVELQGLGRRIQELSKLFSPQMIHLSNHFGTRLAVSSSVVLVTSKFAEGNSAFVEIHLDHCFEVCNRLPRIIQIRRIGGIRTQSAEMQELDDGMKGRQWPNKQVIESEEISANVSEKSEEEREAEGKNSGKEYDEAQPIKGGQPGETYGMSSENELENQDNGSVLTDMEDAQDETGIDPIDREIILLQPGQDIALPIDPDAVIVTLDNFVSRAIFLDFSRRDVSVVQIPLYKIERKAPFRVTKTTSSLGVDSDGDILEPVDVEMLDREDYEAQSGLEAMKICIEFSPSLNSKRHGITNQVIRRNMSSFMRGATIYADAWIVNRLEYPLKLNRFDFHSQIFVPAHSRNIIPADFVNNKMSITIETRHLPSIHAFERYPTKGQGWFFATQPMAAVSDEFLVTDLATCPIQMKRTATHPSLRYVTCMFAAPTPFMRTTVVSVMPEFVISNERSVPLWAREYVFSNTSKLGKPKSTMVGYIPIPAKTAVEFHPQLSKSNAKIQISGLPVVEEYFEKLIKPLLRTYYSTYSFQKYNFDRDGKCWSPPFEVSHPRVVQVRHPCVPTHAGQTCHFSLTEVEVSIRNGVSFIRLVDPNVPDYRFINMTSQCLAIGQHDSDFFEAIRPVSDSHRYVISHLTHKRRCTVSSPGEEERQAQDLLEYLSLPFSWYNPKGSRKLIVWAVNEIPKRRRRGGTEFISGSNEEEESTEKNRDFAFSVVTQARKKAAEEYSTVESNVIAVNEGMNVEGGPKASSSTRTIDVAVDAEQIKIWGAAREYPGFLKLLDIESLFHNLKTARNRKPRSTVLIVLRQWSSNFEVEMDDPTARKEMALQAPLLPVIARLRVISGSKVIFFEEYKGALPSQFQDHALSTKVKPTIVKGVRLEKDSGNSSQNSIGDAIDSSIRQTVIHLWIKGQYSDDMLRDLSAIVRHNYVATSQLAALWELGSEDARQKFNEYLDEAGIQINFDELSLQLKRKTKEETPSLRLSHSKKEKVEQGLADQAGPMELSAVALHPVQFNPAIIMRVEFKGFGVSLIDHAPAEFLYISLGKLVLSLELRPEEIGIRATLGWLQIDNPSGDAYYPTVLRPIDNLASATCKDMILDIELLQKVLPLVPANERSLLEIPKVSIFLRPLSLNIDVQMLTCLLKFVDDILTTMDIEVLNSSVREITVSESTPNSLEWRQLLGPPIFMLETGVQVDKIFISVFTIGRLSFIVNIRSGRQGATSTEEPPKTEVIRAVLSALNVRASISDAHLVLSQRTQKDICGPVDRLVEEIVLSYVGNAVGQLHKVLGAIDLLGNPAMLVKHVTSGAKNGAVELRRGVTSGEVGKASLSCGRAAMHVLNGCCAGIFDFSTRCFGSWYGITDMIARNTDKYSLNPDLIKQGGLLDQPSNCFEGTWVGCHSCIMNFGLSAANIVHKPYKGIRLGLAEAADYDTKQKKCAACCKGCTFGSLSGISSICGLPSSMLLCGQFTTAGVLNQISAISMLSSVRPRRVFTDGVTRLRSYSMGHALCQQMLRELPESAVCNVHVVICLDPVKPNETLCDKFKRKLKLSTSSEGLQDFLGLGTRRFGLFLKRKLQWYINHSDILSIEVISVDINPKKSNKAVELRKQKTKKGVQITQQDSQKPRFSATRLISGKKVVTFASGTNREKPIRVVQASNRRKRQAQRDAERERQKLTVEMEWWIKFIIHDRVAAAAQQILLNYRAQYVARQSSAAERPKSGLLKTLTYMGSGEKTLKALSQSPTLQHKYSVEGRTEVHQDDESDEKKEDSSDEDLTGLDRKEALHVLKTVSESHQPPQKLEKRISTIIASRGITLPRGSISKDTRAHSKALRLVKCPDKFTAFEVFAYMSNHLQADLYSTRKLFQQAVMSKAAFSKMSLGYGD